MTVTILQSPGAAGKTAACLTAIREAQVRRPLAEIWALLANRPQAVAFRRRLALNGGALGVQALAIDDFCLAVLERAGQRLPLASEALTHQCVKATLAAAGLRYYAGLAGQPGFALTIEGALRELKRAGLSAADLEERFRDAPPARRELAAVYRQYQDLLASTGWSDRDGLADLASRALRANQNLFASAELLVVDGLDEFTPPRLDVLRLLAGRVAHVLITLPGGPAALSPQARARLSTQLGAEIHTTNEAPFLPEPLAYLGTNLFAPAPQPYPHPAEAVQLLEARSPAEEAREALRWVKAGALRGGAPLDGFAVLVPDPDRYAAHLRAAAAEFGLTLRFTQSRLLSETPAVAALLNLLDLPPLGYPRRPVLDALRSPFFDLAPIGLTRPQVDALDRVSRAGIVMGGIQQWEQVFDLLKARPAEDLPPEGEEEELRAPQLPTGPAAAALESAFRAFLAACAPPAGTRPLPAWIAWLEDLLDRLGFITRSGGADSSLLAALRDCLRGLLLADQVLHTAQAPDYAGFLAALRGALQAAGYREDPPFGSAAVQVLRPLEARGLRFDRLALLGLSEGIFPAVERPDPLLDEDLRAELGLPSRLEGNQAGLFYQAVTRAEHALLLTRPYLSDTGDPWEASPFWNAAQALFPHCVRRVRPEDPRPLAEAASGQELLFWALRRRDQAGRNLDEPAYADLLPRWQAVNRAQARLADLLQPPPFSGTAQALAGRISAQFPVDRPWSASRLESYAVCPYHFFVEDVLAVEANLPPQWDFDPAQLGAMLHAALERAYRTAGVASDPLAVVEALRQVVPQVFREAPARYGFRPSPLWEAQQAELAQRLERTVLALAEKSAGWRPLHFEAPFGRQGVPPLALDLEDERLLLQGIIDRVDVDDQGGLRVIDYKTGGSHLDSRDLHTGRRLQLGVYALAARDALGLGEPTAGFYWKILQAAPSSLKLEDFDEGGYGGPEGAVELTVERLRDLLAGIRRAEFSARPLDGRCPDYCSAAAWCWQYRPERG